jgi:hypothetical protein
MGGIRQYRALIAWVALVALVGNLAAGMLCFVPLKFAALDLPPELAAAMEMCADHGKPAPGDDPVPAPSKPCQICTAATLLSFILLVAVLLGLVAPARPRWFASRFISTLADELRRAGLGSRAPPLPA